MEYYPAIKKQKKKQNFAIYSNMFRLGGHYANWNTSDKERQMLIFVELKKYNKLVNITKKKQTQIKRTK